MPSTFPHPRFPSEDPAVEAARVTAYWAWLEANPPQDMYHSTIREFVGSDMFLTDIKNEGHADFEAFHMQHSIGHSWTKYSAMGQLWSMRSAEGVPVVTALVMGSEIVHAKEARNARLSQENAFTLYLFASAMKLTVKPDVPHFDAWASELPMTEVVYLHRAEDNAKTFFSAHVKGCLTAETMETMRSALDDGDFVPSRLGLDHASEGTHEIVCLKGSSVTEASEGLGLEDVLLSVQDSRRSPAP